MACACRMPQSHRSLNVLGLPAIRFRFETTAKNKKKSHVALRSSRVTAPAKLGRVAKRLTYTLSTTPVCMPVCGANNLQSFLNGEQSLPRRLKLLWLSILDGRWSMATSKRATGALHGTRYAVRFRHQGARAPFAFCLASVGGCMSLGLRSLDWLRAGR